MRRVWSHPKIIIMIWIGVFFAGCSFFGDNPTPEETQKPQKPPEFIKKTTIYTQVDGDAQKNSIKITEEQWGENRLIRVRMIKNGVNSEIIHPVDSSNFVISIPLQDIDTGTFTHKVVHFEETLLESLRNTLALYIAPTRFNLSLRISWNNKKLDEIRLKTSALDADTLSENATLHLDMLKAVKRMEIDVLLDKGLPKHYDRFIGLLLPSQVGYNKKRGDVISFTRVPFPKDATDSISPIEEEFLTQKIEQILSRYVSKTDYLVRVKILWLSNTTSFDSATVDPNTEMKIQVNLVLNDIVDPALDPFLREVIPLALNLNAERGDTLSISRKRFPEEDLTLSLQSENASVETNDSNTIDAMKNEILRAYEQNDYQEALRIVNINLKKIKNRNEKVRFLKMKGSLHFLLQDKKAAREAWEEVLRLVPDDQEAAQTLNRIGR